MNRITKLLLGILLLGPITPCAAMSLGDIGSDIYDNAKISFLDKAQVGVGFNLKHDEEGAAPVALLDIWQYRFLILSGGFANARDSERKGAPSLLVGIHVDKLTRLIAPNASDAVRSVVPALLRPGYDKLTISYGPARDFDRNEWTHFVTFNLQFGE